MRIAAGAHAQHQSLLPTEVHNVLKQDRLVPRNCARTNVLCLVANSIADDASRRRHHPMATVVAACAEVDHEHNRLHDKENSILGGL
jgi:hypothetical protein